LRGVAPKEVKSSDIYWGALPWVGLQMIMTLIVMFSPGLVTALLDKGHAQAPQGQEINFQMEDPKPATSSGNNELNFQLDK
jgi:hypothetical protein